MSKYLYLVLNAELSSETCTEIYPSLIHNVKYSLYDKHFDKPLLTYNKDIESFHKKGYIYRDLAEDMDQDIYDDLKSYHDTHNIILVTENAEAAAYFTNQVDSAVVYVNASTRFSDGGQFGLGCEMGISTQKLHARGPMGLKELTSYKYVVTGDGQIRE